MKYKYIAGLLVALSFNSGFAAEAVIGPNSYQEIYSAFHRGGVANINAALKNNEGFNHNNDVDTIRRSAAGLPLRIAVISLNAPGLQTVVEANHEFFKTSLGISLVYGWALNHFKDAITPYYIGRYFSFDKMFQGLADRVDGDDVKTFLKSTFTRGLRAVEDDRWAFYDHMLYLPYAIEKVREIAHVAEAAPSMEMVIANARRSRAEAQTEAANLVPAKAGRTVHLDVVANPADNSKLGCATLAETQECILLRPDFFGTVRTKEQETLLSLPAGTLRTYRFMDKTVEDYVREAYVMLAQPRAAIANQTARTRATFFINGRRATIQQILANLRNADAFVYGEALKDADAIIRNVGFLPNATAGVFPGRLVTDDVVNGLDAALVWTLARDFSIPSFQAIKDFVADSWLTNLPGAPGRREAIHTALKALKVRGILA